MGGRPQETTVTQARKRKYDDGDEHSDAGNDDGDTNNDEKQDSDGNKDGDDDKDGDGEKKEDDGDRRRCEEYEQVAPAHGRAPKPPHRTRYS